MRRLVLEMQVSLDGFMAGPDGDTNWMIWNWGPQWAWDDALKSIIHNSPNPRTVFSSADKW